MKIAIALILGSVLALPATGVRAATVVIDTGQDVCYDNTTEIDCPSPGEPFHGQDAQYNGTQPSYVTGGDGLTVYDSNTGLRWTQSPDINGDGEIDIDDKLGWADAQEYPDVLNAQTYGGFDDWRSPTIKELYSLIDFSGRTGMGAASSIPYIDTDYFDFAYGDESAGERFIDAQTWSATEYVGTTMNNDPTAFGVNFADGRIKGYPRDMMQQYVRFVRGPTDYGENSFVDNDDGTITDLATGLIWAKSDSDVAMNWEDALAYAEGLVLAGNDDWRVPNAKELQSIVDYTRAPDAQDPGQQGPAIDPIFELTDDDSWCWASTTHYDGPSPEKAVYVCFGLAWGYLGPPGQGQWVNVHGAGAQRSDPKDGDPNDWPYGHGPQGDEIRIFNYVRAVRGTSSSTGVDSGDSQGPPAGDSMQLGLRAFPNPSDGATAFDIDLPATARARLEIYDVTGRKVRSLFDDTLTAGPHRFVWDGRDAASRIVAPGIYIARLATATSSRSVKLMWRP